MLLRSARPAERDHLSALARRSKAHWPYDAAALAAYRSELEVHAEDILAEVVRVLEVDGNVVGFYALSAAPRSERLHFLFVEPAFIGRGYGKILWTHAVADARARGWRALSFYADAYAIAAFYGFLGCRVTGALPSSLGPLTELTFALHPPNRPE